MSFCTYCVWKHPGTGRAGFAGCSRKNILGRPQPVSAQYCVLWPSNKFALCAPGAARCRNG